MRPRTLAFATVAVVAVVFLAVPPGVAEDREAPGDEGVSAYSVARLKIFEGSAWVRTPDSGEWEEFHHNSPLPERARVSVPEGSEGEIQFHGGQFMLLTGGAEVDIRRLGDEKSVFRLRVGEIRLSLPAEDFAPARVVAPGGAVDFPSPGRYGLTADEAGESRLIVRSGAAVVEAESGRFEVKEGEEARIGRDVRIGRAGEDAGTADEEPAPLSEAESEAGVPPALAHELRDYGEWVDSPTYGYVWKPQVASGWAPYHYGRWVWVSPYGWVWVSDEPWGWYPYHYGYWYADPLFGWCWFPFRSFVSVSFVFGNLRFTHFHGRAVFVPATVRFVRSGRDVRWVPLRPGERHASRVAFTRADVRLGGWERRVPEKTVFVRGRGDKGKAWRDWAETSRSTRGRRVTSASPSRPGREAAPGVRGGETRGRGGTAVTPPPGRGGGPPRGPGRDRRSDVLPRDEGGRGESREVGEPRRERGEGSDGRRPRMERSPGKGKGRGRGSFNRIESPGRTLVVEPRARPRGDGVAGPPLSRETSVTRALPSGPMAAAPAPAPRVRAGAMGAGVGGGRSEGRGTPALVPRLGGGEGGGPSFFGGKGRRGVDVGDFSAPGGGGRGGGGRGGRR